MEDLLDSAWHKEILRMGEVMKLAEKLYGKKQVDSESFIAFMLADKHYKKGMRA